MTRKIVQIRLDQLWTNHQIRKARRLIAANPPEMHDRAAHCTAPICLRLMPSVR
ncbi:MAG: hypothetical protein AAGE37_02975 [Pseudomonadota bacterium]